MNTADNEPTTDSPPLKQRIFDSSAVIIASFFIAGVITAAVSYILWLVFSSAMQNALLERCNLQTMRAAMESSVDNNGVMVKVDLAQPCVNYAQLATANLAVYWPVVSYPLWMIATACVLYLGTQRWSATPSAFKLAVYGILFTGVMSLTLVVSLFGTIVHGVLSQALLP